MYVSDHKINEIRSLVEAIQFANNRFIGQVWWRGQRDYRWALRPSCFRTYNESGESSGILRFQQKALSRHLNVPPIEDLPGWLFLMQHYRLPTRLLDWTESPLIASYFASEVYECHEKHPEDIDETDGALFALSPYNLNKHQLGKEVLLMPEEPESVSAMKPAFNVDAQEIEKVIAIRPSEVDVRLMVQLSVFTLNGYDISIDDLPSSDDFLIKFLVPKGSKAQLQKELKQLGIRLSSIFPDLDHLAQEIRQISFRPMKKVQDLPPERPSSPRINSFMGYRPPRGGESST